jgi:hypothetical protein
MSNVEITRRRARHFIVSNGAGIIYGHAETLSIALNQQKAFRLMLARGIEPDESHPQWRRYPYSNIPLEILALLNISLPPDKLLKPIHT